LREEEFSHRISQKNTEVRIKIQEARLLHPCYVKGRYCMKDNKDVAGNFPTLGEIIEYYQRDDILSIQGIGE